VSGQVEPVAQPQPEDLGFKPGNVAVVRQGLIAVTTGGTSRAVFAGAGYVSAGKTGTAQAVGMAANTKYNAKALDEHQRDHALYVAFAPADDPKIAVAVIVENAGWGAGAAAPIARRVFDYWLLQQWPSEEDFAATRAGKSAAPIGKPRALADVPWGAAGVEPVPLAAGSASAVLAAAAVPLRR
jgi:penicillin-binding protein 2